MKKRNYSQLRPEVESFTFDLPGMKVGSVTDDSLATGTTVFVFDKGATASYDERGGSVGAIETNLLNEGSYSNEIDAILFAGGSTMGLEATQGVRRRIFSQRSHQAGSFDFIPSVPGAVVYDYSARTEKAQNKLIFPTLTMGAAAYDKAVANQMLIGRVGAGTSTTANKVSSAIWGGQGADFKEIRFEDQSSMKIFTAVILNPRGNILMPNEISVDEIQMSEFRKKITEGHKQNTTLSLVVTDVSLDRNQLKRLAAMVHTSMASSISPFQTYTDGDILFAVSLHKKSLSDLSFKEAYKREGLIQIEAAASMKQAIYRSVTVANSKLKKES